jgi:hypothetical protein
MTSGDVDTQFFQPDYSYGLAAVHPLQKEIYRFFLHFIRSHHFLHALSLKVEYSTYPDEQYPIHNSVHSTGNCIAILA